MTNPVVLIATHERIDITTRNIDSLIRQTIIPKIILVCSPHDLQDYESIDCDKLHVIYDGNKPLGKKWQRGVDEIRTHFSTANPLIICGSDDILGHDFIKNACKLIEQGNHFIGLQRWWQHKDGRGYFCDYLPDLPLGGGRCYSAEMLKAINYQVFDTTKDKHLDDFGYENVRKTNLKKMVIRNTEKYGLSIHAIKGDWPVLNNFTLNHKNLRLLRSEPSEKVLPEFFKPIIL